MHQPVDEEDLDWIAEQKGRVVEALRPPSISAGYSNSLTAQLRAMYQNVSLATATARLPVTRIKGKRVWFSLAPMSASRPLFKTRRRTTQHRV